MFAFLSLRRQKVSTSCSQRRTRVSAKCFSIFVWRLVSKFAFFFNLLKQSRDGGANFAFVLRLLAQTVRHFRSFSPFLQKCEHFRMPQSVSASSRLVAREAFYFNLFKSRPTRQRSASCVWSRERRKANDSVSAPHHMRQET